MISKTIEFFFKFMHSKCVHLKDLVSIPYMYRINIATGLLQNS